MFRKALVASVLCIVLVGIAHAVPVTYNFSGTLNDPFGSLSVGTPFSGSFSYDDSQVLNTPLMPYRGDYTASDMSFTISGATITSFGVKTINIYDHGIAGSYPPGGAGETTGYPSDMFHLYAGYLGSGIVGGLKLDMLQVVLQDTSGQVFNDASIPGPNMTISDFTLGNATFIQLTEVQLPDPGFTAATVRGELSYLSATPVPEPASLILMISGIGVLASMRKFRISGKQG